MALGMPKPPAWAEQARCLNSPVELFFPISAKDDATEAKWFCNRCQVRNECLETALEQGNDYGVFGGLTEVERRILKRERRKEERARQHKKPKPRRRKEKTA